MADARFSFYGDISKFDMDGESLLVSGILSTPTEDKQGDIISPEAMRKALGDYLMNGTCREMHQPIAAGKPLSAFVDDEGKTHVTVKVVDKNTIAKVKEGVLKGFSIGAKALKRMGKTITELKLNDASLVDIPCNPECVFELVKFDKPGDECSDLECSHHKEGATRRCASCLSKADEIEKCGCGAKISKGMEKCKKCMEKADEDEKSEKSMKKMFCEIVGLPESVSDEDLQKALKTRLTAEPTATDEKLNKVLQSIGQLEKAAKDAAERATSAERGAIIQKMQRECRVAMKSENLAYTVDELQKMDLGTLQVLSVNSPKLPAQAIHLYKADSTKPRIPHGADGKPLTGFALTESALEQQYGDLEKMLSVPLQTN